jgi:predicted TIM-barrel fold metal-dependent hydrolase
MELHSGPRSTAELLPYLPARYRERYREVRTHFSGAGMEQRGGNNRKDTSGPGGAPPASDPAFIAAQLLDAYEIEYVVCTGNMWTVGTMADHAYATALARAYNDWQLHEWLPKDPRYLGVVVVAPQDPASAAAEIERIGSHPRVVEVLLSAASEVPYGRRHYDPLYAAAQALGLPVATHTTAEGKGMTGAPTPAGYPSRYLEYHTNLALNPMAQLVSLVTAGVFARFPDLVFVQMEAGVSWVPPLLWRLDQEWRRLRSEVPHLTELPSTSVKRQVRFGTQPMEEPNDPDRLLETWALVDGERTLVYSSDYPHWDFDDPYRALPARLPEAWRRRVLRENARDLFARKLAALEADPAAPAPAAPEAPR